MEPLLRRVLLADAGHDTVNLTADALLPLILIDPTAFSALGRVCNAFIVSRNALLLGLEPRAVYSHLRL